MPSISLTDVVTAIKEVQKWDERTKASLTEYTKKTNIYNRLYIESTIAEDDIAIPLITTLNQLVCSYVFTALQLNQFVSGTTTVKELVQLVSTEALVDAVEVIDNKFGASVYNKPVISVEGINSDGVVTNAEMVQYYAKVASDYGSDFSGLTSRSTENVVTTAQAANAYMANEAAFSAGATSYIETSA